VNARYDRTSLFYEFEHWSTLVFVSNLLHGSSLALLEDKQKFKIGGCVGAKKTSISYTNMSSICIK
jgi:hypothetical protein